MHGSNPITLARDWQERVTALCQAFVRTPSLSGHEEAMADQVAGAMRQMGYDDVSVDPAGNVLGWVAGGTGKPIMLHAHMDVVDPGPADLWTHGPWEGGRHAGRVWGRGAVDDKASLASQVCAGGLMIAHGLRPAGDVLVAAVVGEETGGLGTLALCEYLDVALGIVGEPSANCLKRGHRGRFELVVTFYGRSAHGSTPHLGRNPHFALARFVSRLDTVALGSDPVLGAASLAPTLVTCDQTSTNVIPSRLSLCIDWRSVPSEQSQQAKEDLQQLADACCEAGVTAKVVLRECSLRSYTGMERMLPYVMPSFVMSLDDPALLAAERVLGRAVEHDIVVDTWRFATDGGHLVEAGIPCVGYGPGDPAMAHVADESVAVDELIEATAGYLGLALFLGEEIA